MFNYRPWLKFETIGLAILLLLGEKAGMRASYTIADVSPR
jgi:hypothetical protein